MKIITISSNDQTISYGPSVHFQELWNNFAILYKNTSIIGISPHWNKSKETITDCKFRLIKIPVFNLPKIRQVFYDASIMIILLFFSKKKIIYIRLSHFHLFTLTLLILLKRQYYIELNGIIADDNKSAGTTSFMSKFMVWQEKKMIKNATGVIAVSDKISQFAEKYNRNVITIKNRVSDMFFMPSNVSRESKLINSDKLIAIYVGTYTSWDGSDLIPELARSYPNVHFIMVGDGARRKMIEKVSPSNVEYIGRINYQDLMAYYMKAHFGIVLYEYERHKNVELTSLKTLEYIASGLPVFTTHVPGQLFIEDNQMGMCIKADMSLQTSFKDFIDNLSFYTENTKLYNTLHKEKILWTGAARETYDFIQAHSSRDLAPIRE